MAEMPLCMGRSWEKVLCLLHLLFLLCSQLGWGMGMGDVNVLVVGMFRR